MNAKEDAEHLHHQLVKLGDMLGDGDAEPWVKREYARVAAALGYTVKPKRNRTPMTPERREEINQRMKTRCAPVACPECDGALKQTQSGSMRAVRTGCGQKYQLLRKSRRSH